jgi:hypothetical protein
LPPPDKPPISRLLIAPSGRIVGTPICRVRRSHRFRGADDADPVDGPGHARRETATTDAAGAAEVYRNVTPANPR